MARTPLLDFFEALAADHEAADAEGISVEQVRERRLSRRSVLKGAAGVAVVGALAAAKVPMARAAGSPRIAIIGGGIAGLTAALTLADKGIASTVYEASDRLGGRMHSNTSGYWADDQVSEWCGELIDQNHKTMLSLAQRYRLATDSLLAAEPKGSEDTYYFFGRYYSKDQADSDFRPVHQALQRDTQAASYPTTYDISTAAGRELDFMSVYQWIESRVPGGHSSPLGQLLDVAYNIEYGGETTDQSALNLVYLLGYNAKPGNFVIFGASNERYHIRGGNQQLPLAIAADISARGVTVQTGMRLSSLSRQSNGTYTLSFDKKSKAVTADHVVMAIPFATLRMLDYSRAGFDAQKDTAIRELGVSRNAKLQLQFSERLWAESGPWGISNGVSYADTGYQNTWDVSRAQPGASGILVNYTGGNVAGSFKASRPFSEASPKGGQVNAYAKAFLEQLEPVYPGISAAWNGRATLSVPMLDPNLNCAYCYYRVGQWSTIGGYEIVRQGNVHFAGDQCTQDFQGYMEGGASTGVLAASEILADLK